MNPNPIRRLLVAAPLTIAWALAGCSDEGAPPTTFDITIDDNNGSQVDTTPPAVPVNLAVYGDPQSGMAVQWDENAEADLAGYVLERSIDHRQTWTPVSNDPLSVAAFTDTYYARADYRVASVDLSENQSAYSSPSGWVFVPGGGKNPTEPISP